MNEEDREEQAAAGDQPIGDAANDPDDPNRRGRRRGRRGRGGPPIAGQPQFRPQPQGFRPQGQGMRPAQGFRPQPQGFRAPGQGFRPQGPPRPQGPGFRPQPQGFRPQAPSFRGQPAFRPATPPEARPGEDEGSLQAREVAAYERRQEQQDRRGQWRGAGAWRPRGAARPGGNYAETIRRATAGPRSAAAPSHDAGEPIAGSHAVLEAIRAGRGMRRLYVSQDRGTHSGPVSDVIAEAQQRGIAVQFVDKLEIARVSPIEDHQGVVAIVEGRPGVDLDELLLHLDAVSDPGLVLVIDSLQDPQNFGVLLRSAEGAGVDGIVIPRHRSVGLTPAVAKTSAGASEHLLVADVPNLRQAIDALKDKGLWVVGTDETGDLLYDEVDYRGPTAVVIGGEGEGIRRLVLEGCDQVVRIPMSGRVASLNAASAGTVVLYEALRQRRRDVAPPTTRTPAPERSRDDTQREDAEAGEAEFAESRLLAEREVADAGPRDAAIGETAIGRDPAVGSRRQAESKVQSDAADATAAKRHRTTAQAGPRSSHRPTTEVAEGEIVDEREVERTPAAVDASAVITVSVAEDEIAPGRDPSRGEDGDAVIDVAVKPTPPRRDGGDAVPDVPHKPRPPRGGAPAAGTPKRPRAAESTTKKTAAKSSKPAATVRGRAKRDPGA